MTETETRHPAAVAAANWWAKAIGAPTFRNTCERDSTQDQLNGGMAGMLASVLADQHPVTEETGAAFAELLAEEITRRTADGRVGVTLGVDYGPDMVLAGVAGRVGVDGSRFPWKTTMWVKGDIVTVSAGYGAAQRIVWASDEWMANRPPCARQRWDRTRGCDAEYTGDPFVCSLLKYHEGDCQHDTPVSLCRTCGHRSDDYIHTEDGFNTRCHDFDGLPAGTPFTAAPAPTGVAR